MYLQILRFIYTILIWTDKFIKSTAEYKDDQESETDKSNLEDLRKMIELMKPHSKKVTTTLTRVKHLSAVVKQMKARL